MPRDRQTGIIFSALTGIVFCFTIQTRAQDHAGHEMDDQKKPIHQAQVEPPGIVVRLDQTKVSAGEVILSFDLKTSVGISLTSENLDFKHQKQIHMLVHDDARTELQHVHPQFSVTLQKWVVEGLRFTRNGKYLVWVEGTHLDERVERKDGLTKSFEISSHPFLLKTSIEVTGGYNPFPAISHSEDLKSTTGFVTATLDPAMSGNLNKGKIVVRSNTKVPSISQWLGGFAHLIIVSLDRDELIHGHAASYTRGSPCDGYCSSIDFEVMHDEAGTPMDHGGMQMAVGAASDLKPGRYRIWAQAKVDSEVQTFSFLYEQQ